MSSFKSVNPYFSVHKIFYLMISLSLLYSCLSLELCESIDIWVSNFLLLYFPYIYIYVLFSYFLSEILKLIFKSSTDEYFIPIITCYHFQKSISIQFHKHLLRIYYIKFTAFGNGLLGVVDKF